MKITEASKLQHLLFEEGFGPHFTYLVTKKLQEQETSPALKIGIMGGTFDPIHWGHLVCANQVAEHCELDLVLFMVTGNPAFKQDQYVSPAVHRAAMVEIAIAKNKVFELCQFEMLKSGISYTSQTLSEFADLLSSIGLETKRDLELFFITGADAVLSILAWHEPEKICDLAHILAVRRPGYDLSKLDSLLKDSSIKEALSSIEIPALSISSSYLRKRLAQGKSVAYLTDSRVIDYIEEHKLYGA